MCKTFELCILIKRIPLIKRLFKIFHLLHQTGDKDLEKSNDTWCGL